MKKYNNKKICIWLLVILAISSLFIYLIQYEGFINRRQRQPPIGGNEPNPDCSNTVPTIVKSCNQYTSSGGKCPCINAKTNGGSNKCMWVVSKDHNGNPVQGLTYGGECQTLY
jgi:hypothetical protein